MLSTQNGALLFHMDAETMIIEAWGRDSLRVRATKLPEIPTTEWALIQPKQEVKATVTIFDGYAVIENGKIKATVDKSGKIFFQNSAGKVLLEEYVRNRKLYNFAPGIVPSGFASALDIEAREFKPILGGDYALTARFESDPEEKIYGLGQYQQPNLDQKGCELELAHRNSQASVPFALSSLGYGFLWNNPSVGRVSFAKNVTTWTATSTKVLDYWITAGDSPADILENYSMATGSVPMMPDWAMGFWQCKLRYQTQEELLTVAREYKRRGVPLSVIVVDFFHWTMQGDWKFDKKYWPDPQAMVDELKSMGVELMVSIWPTVDHRSENFQEMTEKGYLIRTDRGQRIAMIFQGNTVHFDATNPGAREYVWNKAKQNYYDYGIKLFWLDEAEPEYTYYDFDLYRYHQGPNVEIGNLYPMLYARAFYDGMTGEGQENVINLLRCAWAGSQRYGALVWSGDIDSSFRSLRNQFAAGLNMGIAGIPWWTTDIGGFHGGDASSEEFRECFTRWFQYATFCPVMRLHGDREPHTPPMDASQGIGVGGGSCPSGAANEIWSYGEDIYEICKDFIGIRGKLLPYIREQMALAHEKGQPPMRPLFFDYPDDEAAWKVQDEFLFGPDILVAPVLYSGLREREVYLPKGASWKDAWTDETFDGGQTITAAAPIERIPVFIRAGAGLELR
ncbi:MAG: glycoside hydrolase family 31 protein [Oscillospiraceae bacterium]|jgi:alpha-D-xyloside xylohydrolase|nr:glycoside hydrolase family 31 protein [Oscillospiraceae bacterium]